jgi:RNA polymerase primary sigma factor
MAAEQAYRDRGGKSSSLGAYLRDISKVPLLTREEEIRLGKLAQKGDQKAIQKLVEANLRFVVKVANRFSGAGPSLLDLINTGNIGLIEAARRFDPSRNVKFISYAVWWIRQAIMQMLAEQSGPTRLPLKQAGVLYRVRSITEELTKRNNREPTPREIAQVLVAAEAREAGHKLTKAELERELTGKMRDVEEVLRVARRPVSLDSPVSDDSDTAYLELMADEDAAPVDQELIQSQLSSEIAQLLGNLTPREREVVEMRAGIGCEKEMTLEDVGQKLGLSRERIRQIEKKAKKKLQRLARGRKLMDFLS